MIRERVQAKWRPRLGLVVLGVLLGVLALPMAIVLSFRALDHATPMRPFELAALLAAVLATLLVAFVLTRTITGPIEALMRRSEEIGRGGRDAIRPLDAYGTEEIATLSQSFLDLATRLVERGDYVQTFAAHVSHELKSPLTSIRGAAELLRDDAASPTMTPEERGRFLDHLIADADRMTALLARLRELARAELPAPAGLTSLAAIVGDMASRFPALAVEARGDTALPVGLSAEAAAVIFGHLAQNANQHGATRLQIDVHRNGRMATLTVADNGRGIAPADRDHVLQPFFTTRRDEGGSGMGLAIARAMLAAHGGTIRVLDSEHGARFEIELPAG